METIYLSLRAPFSWDPRYMNKLQKKIKNLRIRYIFVGKKFKKTRWFFPWFKTLTGSRVGFGSAFPRFPWIHIKMIQVHTAASNDYLNILGFFLGVSIVVRFFFLCGKSKDSVQILCKVALRFFSLREKHAHYMNPFHLNMHICFAYCIITIYMGLKQTF